eukprot:CAMPEP_0203842776 /NCGR_PEP_ID=MMETSP0359-20131031/2198_1 /ASSEMBLY_ACC=CAM_ASM_000338 /TAXON_ID=268821 /ORGANISM="Scrippsiella Hangoei, Strain SHTV-5" /LENGTH=69 /DNA_ID=CAMNT_0050757427 /DNA_START=23 /DNA_END=230 /DNA_ORIENTATION=-
MLSEEQSASVGKLRSQAQEAAQAEHIHLTQARRDAHAPMQVPATTNLPDTNKHPAKPPGAARTSSRTLA